MKRVYKKCGKFLLRRGLTATSSAVINMAIPIIALEYGVTNEIVMGWFERFFDIDF